MPKIIVFTSGRSGSHLIQANLAQEFYNKYNVLQTHNPMLSVSPDDICIINKRRDNFMACLSMCVASKLNKFHFYQDDQEFTDIDPFEIDENYFTNLCFFQKAFYKTLELRNFSNQIEIYYEDLIADEFHLFSKFGITRSLSNDAVVKSPYNTLDYVLNYEKLKNIFNIEMAKDISELQLQEFIAGVEKDLADISENHDGNRYY
jgi:hypothetical protein